MSKLNLFIFYWLFIRSLRYRSKAFICVAVKA